MSRLIIDADAHLTEPPDLWTSRIPKRYADDVPRLVRDDDGRDVWKLGGVTISIVGLTAIAGWDGFPPDPPRTYEECHSGAYDADARLRYMDEAGIWAQVLYPNVAGFGSQQFLKIPNRELQLLCVQAYNDFLHEWSRADPRRLIGVMSLPFWDVEAAVAEVERCAELGFRGILFTGEPQRFGMPILGSRRWDPLWSVAQSTGLPIHFHVGAGEDTTVMTPERIEMTGVNGTTAYAATNILMKNAGQTADLITSGLLARFPDLKFVSVESGIGWIPIVLEMTDYMYQQWTPDCDLLPSDLFRRQVYSTHWFEQTAPQRLLGKIPVDNILFETDFPHGSCLYGNRQITETIERGLGSLDEQDRRKILWDNAASLYRIEAPQGVLAAS